VKPLSDSEDPRWRKSTTEQNWESRMYWLTVRADPMVQKLRTLHELPSKAKSIVDKDELRRQIPYTDSEDPRRVNDRSEKQLPKWK
jgi:hypothetical protein